MNGISTDLKTHAVLCVDDEQQTCKYFRKGWEKEFRVLTATSVAEAVSILEREGATIGVVITDQRMPGQSGVELLTQVRQRWPAVVRILTTAYSDLDSAVAAVNTGNIYKYITKPADAAVVREALTEALNLYRQTIERDALAATLRELEAQREATRVAEGQREQLQQRLIAASREAGRAEVATGILHNVGNVLNSVNVSVAVVTKTLHQSKLAMLGKTLELLEAHRADLANYITADERGKLLPDYLQKLGGLLGEEQNAIAAEMSSLARNLEHIGQVVQMQQSYAKEPNLRQPADPVELMEQALSVNATALTEGIVQIERKFSPLPVSMLDKHKVLQILINLVRNATNAIKDRAEKRIILVVESITAGDSPHLRFQVIDSGHGIAEENLTRIFIHGFTTRTDGHGFGLHSSANAAREMGGSLTASSGGVDQGATFTLELPVTADVATPDHGAAADTKVAA